MLTIDPFPDDAEFDLAPLPEVAVSLLVEAGVPQRLAAHLRLVHEIASAAAVLLKTDPNQRPDIVWYGEKCNPPFTGPALRKT